MFGQSAASPFGAPAATPFGSPAPAPAFGAPAPAFGAQAPAPSAFGTPAAPAFGSPAAQTPSAFGGFGSTTPAAPATNTGFGFGATPAPAPSAFGAPAASTPFGAPAPATGGLFGAPAPATGGLFGSTPAQAAPAFGAPAPAATGFGAPTTSAFGAAPATSAFGAAAPATGGLFGAPAPAPAGGLFGSTTPAPAPAFGATPAFGSPAPAPSTGLFGAPAPAPSTGLFGAPAPAGNGQGTTVAQYQTTNKVDNNGQINLQSISAMQQYENFSTEELRMQDYKQGNKGSGAAGAATGGFGVAAPAPAAGGGLFGAPAPAAPSTGLFGAPAPAAPSTGLFGAPAPAPAFGAPAPAGGGLFGATPAPAPATGGLFGSAPAPAPGGSLFGAPAPAPGGLFGSAPAPAPVGGSLFGAPAPAPATGGLFGAPAPAAGGGLFGSTPAPAAGGGLFGSTPAPAFGSPAPAPTSLFGAPAPAPAAGGLFGSTPAPAPVAGSLFGAPAPAPGGLFGAPAAAPAFGAPTSAAGGLFGAPAAAPAAGSLFGSPAPTAGASLFGAPAPAQAYGVPAPAVAAPLVPPTADILLAQQIAAVENQNKELAVLQALRDNGSFSGVDVKSPQTSAGGFTATSTFPRSSASVTPYRGLGMDGQQSSYHKGPRSATKIRPRGFGPTRPTASLVLGNGNGTSTMLSPSALIGSSTKRLVIKKGALTPKPAMRLLLKSGSPSKKSSEKKPESPSNGVIKGREALESGTDSTPAPDKQQQSDNLPFENSRITNNQAGVLSPDATTATSIRETPKAVSTPLSEKMSSKKGGTADEETPYDFYKSVVGSPVSGETSGKKLSSVPKLTKEGYITSPSIEELNTMSEADLAAVSNFAISREGFGRISWDGAVDVRGIDLDKVVAIDSRDIAVYDDEESTANKPPAGTKLNRPAVLTLQNIYPKDGVAQEKFEQKLIKKSTTMEADFISYDISTGEWKFRVHHFSRYGLDDDDDTDIEDEAIDSKQDFNSGARGGRVQDSTEGMDETVTDVKRSSRIRIEDEDMFGSEEDNLQLLSDREDPILDAAQSAYDRLPYIREEEQDVHMEMDDKKAWFEDNGESQCEYVLEAVPKPLMIPIPSTNSLGISAKIARKCGVKSATSSSTDFGMRFGRSFRVGWHPDGTLLHPARMDNMHVVVRSRPVVAASSNSNETLISDKLLAVQMKHAEKMETSDGCPIFELNSTGEGKESAVLNEYEEVSRIESQSKDDDFSGLLASAISLIHLENSKSDVTRRNCAFSRWLRNINEDDVKEEIRNGKDDYSGIFAALSGNNYDLAGTIAREKGLFMLSLLLTNSSAMGADGLMQQIDLWENNGSSNHIPTNLMRIYKLLGRDEEVEEYIFKESLKKNAPYLNWKRRLAILEQCSDEGKDCEQFISSILSKYDSDVSKGSSPPPHSWYLVDNPNKRYPNSFVSCTLYRLLSLFNGVGTECNDQTMTLSEAISPSGYTPFHHDVAISFHLAFVMNAVGASDTLSERQESALLESYALQLVEHGKWEWAVYVALCSLTARSPDASMYQHKKRMAMNIFFRNYTDNSSIDEHAIERRYFLERKVGIPPVWFEEALSYRALQEWNPHGFVEHAFNYDSSCALRVYEDMILPDLLFNGGQENCQQIIDFLEAIKEDEMCDWKQAELSCAVYDFLEFSQNVIAVTLPHEASNEGQVSPNVVDSITRLRNIQDSLSRLASRRHTCSTYFGNCNVVPRHVCIAEISRSLMMLEAHLNSLLEGVSVDMEKLFGSSAPRRLNKKLSHVSQYWVPEEQKKVLFTIET